LGKNTRPLDFLSVKTSILLIILYKNIKFTSLDGIKYYIKNYDNSGNVTSTSGNITGTAGIGFNQSFHDSYLIDVVKIDGSLKVVEMSYDGRLIGGTIRTSNSVCGFQVDSIATLNYNKTLNKR